jgi:hypothetical protein
MASQTPPSAPQPPSRALELYWQATGLSLYVKPLDQRTARALIRVAGDAIKEFGNTNQDKIIELERFIGEAKKAVPPEGAKELFGRAESYIIEKTFPKNPILRAALLLILGLILLLPTGLSAWLYLRPTPSKIGSPVVNDPSVIDDPLKILGEWSYKTTFRDKKPKAPDGKEIETVEGINSIEIKHDRIGYSMSGSRTHYTTVGSNAPVKYPEAFNIKLSRISYEDDFKTFYFHFVVSRDGRRGFAEMFLDRRTPSKIPGEIIYLDADGTWTVADIDFTKP